MANRMAKSLRVVREGTGGAPVLYIDGEEFPYFTVDGHQVRINRTAMPGVALTIAAESVEVVDSLNPIVEETD